MRVEEGMATACCQAVVLNKMRKNRFFNSTHMMNPGEKHSDVGVCGEHCIMGMEF